MQLFIFLITLHYAYEHALTVVKSMGVQKSESFSIPKNEIELVAHPSIHPSEK